MEHATEAGPDLHKATAPTLTATEDAGVVAFRLDPEAPITRQGTIGR